jgi:hypothetical protein
MNNFKPIDNILSMTQTEHFLNTILDRYHYTNPCGAIYVDI